MNKARIELIRKMPSGATVEEIVMLADHASREARRRHALFEIVAMVRPLLPAGGIGNRGGGVMERVHRVASEGLKDLGLDDG